MGMGTVASPLSHPLTYSRDGMVANTHIFLLNDFLPEGLANFDVTHGEGAGGGILAEHKGRE